MTTIWDRVDDALTPLGVPFMAHEYTTSSGEDFPDIFMTYILISIDPEEFLNDEEAYRSEMVQVSIYKRENLNGLPDVIGAMKTAGFSFIGGRELEGDEESNHLGIAFDFEYYEKL